MYRRSYLIERQPHKKVLIQDLLRKKILKLFFFLQAVGMGHTHTKYVHVFVLKMNKKIILVHQPKAK